MPTAKKIDLITIEQFQKQYFDTGCQFHQGEVWEAQATTPDHSYLQGSLAEILRTQFNKTSGPQKPGGWWIFTEVAMRYADTSLFSHDLAGWRRARCVERPRRFPIVERPDWVCEILSTNTARDLVTKKAVLHKHEVPFYWIVHPTDKVITVLEWTQKGYTSILDVNEGFEGKIPPFDAINLKANVLFGEEDE